MKRTRIRPVSKRRMKRDAVYNERREEVYERAQGRCEARGVPDCTGRCEQTHHLAGRLGEDPHRLSNLIGVCHHCHDAIHHYPAWARAKGFMVSRLADAEGEALPGGAA